MDVDIEIGATEVVSTLTDLSSGVGSTSGSQLESTTTKGGVDKSKNTSDLVIDEMEVGGKGGIAEGTSTANKPSPKKRRDDGGDIVDEDNNVVVSAEDKENLAKKIKLMGRRELEAIVLLKVVQAIHQHTEAGKMKTKIWELQAQKDKMYHRVGHLQKQVQEMSRALKLLVDNHNRDPNNLNPDKPKPPPIKFFRSVGLQVVTEPAYRSGPTKIIHINHDTPPVNGNNGTKPVNVNGTPVYTVNGPQRVNNNKKIAPANNNNNSSLQKVRVVNGQSPNKVGGVAVQAGVLKTISRPANGSSPNKTVASPTIVDLTDDPAGGVVTSGAVQYRLVNSQQIISSTQQQSYHIVNSNVPGGGGLKPVFLTTTGTGQNPRGVQYVVRNVTPKTSATGTFTQTRPSVTRPNVLGPKVAATINTSIRAPPPPQQLQPAAIITKKPQFTLPALPPSGVTQVPRGSKITQDLPSKPHLTLNEQADGIVLSWTMKTPPTMADIGSYQLYACQEALNPTPTTKPSSWKKVGDVKALPLPMACTLSQFAHGNRYFFIVRAVDQYGRTGPFCDPAPIVLKNKS